MKKWTVINQHDGNDTFEAEGDNYGEAACDALQQLGWAISIPEGDKGDKPSAQVAGLALCRRCAAEQGRFAEWDSFHYGTNRRCDACNRDGLCAMMPNTTAHQRREAAYGDAAGSGLLESKGE